MQSATPSKGKSAEEELEVATHFEFPHLGIENKKLFLRNVF